MICHYLHYLVLSHFRHSSFPLLITFKHTILFLLNISNFSYIELYLSTYSFLLQRLLVVSTIIEYLALFFYSNRILIFIWAHVFFGAFQMALEVMKPTANAGDRRDVGWIPGSGRSPGGGHGNPLQYSCLENFMGRGACRAAVHGIAKSDMIE